MHKDLLPPHTKYHYYSLAS